MRFSSRALCAGTILGMTSCTSMIPPPIPPSRDASVGQGGSLYKALLLVREAKKNIYEELEKRNTMGNEASVVTFLAMAGAAGATAYGANTELILGLAGTGGLAYSAGNLLTPSQVMAVYRSGYSALQCLELPTVGYATALSQLAESRRTLNNYLIDHQKAMAALESISLDKSSLHWDTKAEALSKGWAEIVPSQQAITQADVAASNEAILAETIIATATQIVNDVNNMAAAATPTLQMVMTAAQSTFPDPQGPRSLYTESTINPNDRQKEEPNPDLKTKLATVLISTADIQGARTMVEQKLVDLAKVELKKIDGCNVSLAEVKPLSILPDTIPPISSGTHVRLRVSGGQESYSAKWIGTAPASVSLDVVGADILLLGRTGIVAGEAVLLIDDTLAATEPLKLTVTMK